MKARLVMIAAGVLLAVACSSGSTETLSPSAAAQQYSGAALGVDAAYLQWKAATAGASKVSQITAPAAAYAAALTSFDDALAKLPVGGKAATDIPTLLSADQVVITDLNAAGTQTAGTLAAWARQLAADGAKAIQASKVVRADFGLPPA